MENYVHPQVRTMLAFAGLLESLARAAVVAGHKAYKRHTRRRRGATLRPGPGMPLWNELARHAAVHLRRHGDKANLGRLLGLPRQRIHQLLVERSACPDAERTLMLLLWIQAKMGGRDLFTPVANLSPIR